MRVFLALPDTGLPAEVERAIREALDASKHELLPASPIAHAGLAASERDRFLTTVDRMMEAEMLVADVSTPDAGVGWCVAWMLARGRLVVLTCRRDARGSLSAMIAGNPSPWQRVVFYDTTAELTKELARAIGG